MLRPLRLFDTCLCYCPEPNGYLIQTLQYTTYFEGLPAATVTSLCSTCNDIISVCTGSTRLFIQGKNAAHELSYIPCNTPIPSTLRTYIN
jgi:uncharacterized Zn-binding protein involved in type VI secretion